MELLDSKNKYSLKIDTKRGIVYEKPTGYWKPEDIERLHRDYVNNVIPALSNVDKKRKWAKCVDLRGYKLSMILEGIQKHVDWAVKNGFDEAVIVIAKKDCQKSVKNLQMNMGTQETHIIPKLFPTKKAANEWLKSKGF